MTGLDTLLPASFADYFRDKPERLEKFAALEAEYAAALAACKPVVPMGPES